MSEAVSNNKRIAKNTVFLYFRMLIVMGVTLYTSRVVLLALGIEDFGIYNVIAGLASSFLFFSSSLSNATQRFLNFALGKNDKIGACNVFNLSLLIYTVVAVIVFLLIETVGMWFLNNKLVIPAERMQAAIWVLRLFSVSIGTMLIGSVFDSVLIAQENMKVFAYTGLLDAFLKFVVAFLLSFAPFDKLIFYAVLIFTVTLLSKLVVIVFCLIKYDICRIKIYWNKDLFKRMLNLIGWNGCGCAVWAINDQGLNILLNLFFGPAVNAARGISQQVNSAINNFVNSFITAVRPQIVKSYAAGDFKYFNQLLLMSSRWSYYLLWLLCLPVLLNVDYILTLWLKIVPSYAGDLVRWILAFSLVNVLTQPFWSGIQAVGVLKKYVVIGSSVFLMTFPVSYIFLKMGCTPEIPFKIMTIVRLIYVFVCIAVFKTYVDFSLKIYLGKVLLPIIFVSTISSVVMFFIVRFFQLNFIMFVIETLLSFIVTGLVVLFWGMNKQERGNLFFKIKGKFR